MNIVITTRDNNLIVNSCKPINLKAFNKEESYNYLKRAIVRKIEERQLQALLQKFSNGETYPYELKDLAANVNNNNLEDI